MSLNLLHMNKLNWLACHVFTSYFSLFHFNLILFYFDVSALISFLARSNPHTEIHTHAHTHIYTHTHIHTHTYVHTHTYTHIHTHTYIHTHIHTHTHTHAHTPHLSLTHTLLYCTEPYCTVLWTYTDWKLKSHHSHRIIISKTK